MLWLRRGKPPDSTSEYARCALEDSLHIGDEQAVIDERHALALGLVQAVEHLALVEHAPAAVDDEPVGRPKRDSFCLVEGNIIRKGVL